MTSPYDDLWISPEAYQELKNWDKELNVAPEDNWRDEVEADQESYEEYERDRIQEAAWDSEYISECAEMERLEKMTPEEQEDYWNKMEERDANEEANRHAEEVAIDSHKQEEEHSILNPVHQSCLGCAFAKCDGSIQIGCGLNKIELFRSLDPNNVIEAYDDENEFFIINRACNGFRTKQWAEKHKDTDLVCQVGAENAVKVDVFVYVDNKNISEVSLQATLLSLRHQTHKVNQVIVISNQNVITTADLIGLIRTHGGDLDWMVTRVVEKTNDGNFVRPERAVDIAFSKIKGQFYVFLPLGETLNAHLIENIDIAINERLERFSLLYDEGQVYVVATNLHKHMDGSNSVSPLDNEGNPVYLNHLVDKIVHLATETDGLHMVKDIKMIGGR